MKFITKNKTQYDKIVSTYRLFGLVLIFGFFLTPISFIVRGDSVSGNYSFVFFPLLVLLMGGKLRPPNKNTQTLIGLYTFIFIVCLIYQYHYLIFWERRLISFVLFMSMFIFSLVEIDKLTIKAFRYSIILAAFIYSANSIYIYFSNGGSSLGYEIMRPIVQSQRYGFVLVLGIWLIIFEKTTTKINLILKIIIIATILNGLGLTFSRSSIAGLLVSSTIFIMLFLINLKNKSVTFSLKLIGNIISHSILIAFIILISYLAIPDYFQYFSDKILKISITPFPEGYFTYLKFPPYDTYVYNQLESSEGYRVFMISKVINFIINNPLFGSGFLGVWVMFDDLAGSAHNQLLDILFRSGLIGFIIFLFILFKIIKYNIESKDLAMVIGISGILAIGLFHETFKLSQGAFILSLLIAYALNNPNPNQNPK